MKNPVIKIIKNPDTSKKICKNCAIASYCEHSDFNFDPNDPACASFYEN